MNEYGVLFLKGFYLLCAICLFFHAIKWLWFDIRMLKNHFLLFFKGQVTEGRFQGGIAREVPIMKSWWCVWSIWVEHYDVFTFLVDGKSYSGDVLNRFCSSPMFSPGAKTSILYLPENPKISLPHPFIKESLIMLSLGIPLRLALLAIFEFFIIKLVLGGA